MIRRKFEVLKFNTREELGGYAAKSVMKLSKKLLETKDELSIIFASAPSQLEFLHILAGSNDFPSEKIHAFHMDEYIGLSNDAPQTFGNFLNEHLFSRTKFKSVNLINSQAKDVDTECLRYENLLKNNEIDIVCLGIGENGHIAFNDPPFSRFNDEKYVRMVKLDEKSRIQQVNDGCFESVDLVPKTAITLTIPALLNSHYHFCMVPAKTKSDAVYKTIYGSIGEDCPASVLRLGDNVKLFIDGDSGAKIDF